MIASQFWREKTSSQNLVNQGNLFCFCRSAFIQKCFYKHSCVSRLSVPVPCIQTTCWTQKTLHLFCCVSFFELPSVSLFSVDCARRESEFVSFFLDPFHRPEVLKFDGCCVKHVTLSAFDFISVWFDRQELVVTQVETERSQVRCKDSRCVEIWINIYTWGRGLCYLSSSETRLSWQDCILVWEVSAKKKTTGI